VTIEPYYKWLGSAAAGVCQSHVPRESHLVDSVTVKCEPKALDYIIHTPTLKTTIETRLEHDRCMISWPKSQDDPLELKLKKTAGQKCVAHDWADKCRAVMDTFLSEIKSETVNVLQEIWNNFKMQVEECIRHHSFMIRYDFDNDNCNLYFIGKKDAAEKFRMTVESIKTSLEEELRKKSEQITETISNLSRHQLMILSLCNYADEVAASVKDVKVVITHNEVHMTGMTDNIKKAKLKIYEKLNQLQSGMNTVSKASAELLEKESVKSYLCDCFQRQQVVASWSIHDTELTVFAFSEEQLTIAKGLIQSIVVEKELSLDASSKALISQPKWKEFEKHLTAEHKMVVLYKGKEGFLVMCCIEECSGAVQEKVQDFIEKNSLLQKLVPLMRPLSDLLEQFMSTDLEKIRLKLKQCGGHMKRDDGESEQGFVLLGSRSAVEFASNELMKLTETVAMCDHEIDRPGIPAYLISTSGTSILSDIQRKHQVVIDLENMSTEKAAGGGGRGGSTGTAAVVKYSRKVIMMIFLSHSL